MFRVTLNEEVPPDVLGDLYLDLIAFTPGECVSRFATNVRANTNPEVEKEIKSLVGDFGYYDRRTKCPFGRCDG